MKLISGTASSQLIGIIAAPIVARLFAPEAFGSLGLFAAASGIISVLVCLRYEVAIPLPAADEDAVKLAWLCVGLTCTMTACTLLIVWIVADGIVYPIHLGPFRSFIWLIPISVFFTGIMAVLNGWATRKREFGRLTILNVVGRCCITGLQLALGFAGFVSGAVLIGCSLIGGLIIPTVALSVLTWRDSAELFLGGFRWNHLVSALRRYSRFPKYNISSQVLSTFGAHATTLLLGGFYSPYTVGQYAMGARLVRVPMGLFGSTFSKAFFPRAAAARYDGSLDQLVEKGLKYLTAVAMFPCVLLTLLGKDIFAIAFGQRWSEAGVFCQIMAPMLFLWFIAIPLNTVLLVLEEQALDLRYQGALFTVRICSLVIGALFLGSARWAIFLLAASGLIIYAFYSSTITKKAGLSTSRLIRIVASSFKPLLPAILGLGLLKLAGVRPIVVIAVAGLCLVGYYGRLVCSDGMAGAVFERIFGRRIAGAGTRHRDHLAGQPCAARTVASDPEP